MSALEQPQEKEVTDSTVEKEETGQLLAVSHLSGWLQAKRARPGHKKTRQGLDMATASLPTSCPATILVLGLLLLASGFLLLVVAWAPNEDTQLHAWSKSLALGPLLCFMGLFTIFLGALLRLGARKTGDERFNSLLSTRARQHPDIFKGRKSPGGSRARPLSSQRPSLYSLSTIMYTSSTSGTSRPSLHSISTSMETSSTSSNLEECNGI